MLCALLALSATAVVRPRLPWRTRRLGAVGLAGLPLTLGAFLLSPMVMDPLSARYLIAGLLLLPFALLPAATMLERPWFGAALTPYLASAAIGGWVAYAPATRGWSVRSGLTSDDMRLGAELRARGVRVATADYWVAYRATFLFRESPVVVPTHASQDRYPPYRAAFLEADAYAYIIDRWRSEEPEERVVARIAAAGARYERIVAGEKVALVVHAPPARSPEVAMW